MRVKNSFEANVSGEARWEKRERGKGAGAGECAKQASPVTTSRRPKKTRVSPSSSTALFGIGFCGSEASFVEVKIEVPRGAISRKIQKRVRTSLYEQSKTTLRWLGQSSLSTFRPLPSPVPRLCQTFGIVVGRYCRKQFPRCFLSQLL